MLLLVIATAATAQFTVDDQLKFAFSENLGWTNWRDAKSGADGALMHETFMSGFVWSENAGWINLGDGDPTDGVHYANLDSTDYGVNVDPDTGDLFGLAWGENIGWINFDTASSLAAFDQHARFDESAGRLFGYAWSENTGWINLDDSIHHVAFVAPAGDGDCDNDGDIDLIDFGAFQLCFSGTLPAEPGCECSDFDADGDIDLVDFGQFQLAFTGPG
jgi:hypothetical protein